jgi:hypothetical protein
LPNDYAKAMDWYDKAADQGDADSETIVGDMYENGEGVAKDYAKAMDWYKKAADQGDALAQVAVGAMYYKGEGMPQDYAQTMQWFKKAADQGDAEGQDLVAALYMDGAGVPQDYAKAMEWAKKAADQGDAKAQTDIGDMYEKGEGVAVDPSQAMQWYKKAADQGNADAQAKIAQITNAPASATAPPPAIGQKISLTLKDGSVKTGKLISVAVDGITYLNDEGGGKIDFAEMSSGDQAYFGFDQEKYNAYEQALADEAAKRARIRNIGFDPETAYPEPAQKNWVQVDSVDGVKVNSVDAKVMKHEGEYLDISWRVGLTASNDFNDLFVTVNYLDAGNFKVDHSIEEIKIAAGENRVVSGEIMMTPEDWAKVTKFTVRTD